MNQHLQFHSQARLAFTLIELLAVFSMDSAGLMYEATLGGQKFSYLPKDAVD